MSHLRPSQWRRHRHALVAGYLHEHEEQYAISIPDIVHFTTNKYCTNLISRSLSNRPGGIGVPPFRGDPRSLDSIKQTELAFFGTITTTMCTEFRYVMHALSTSFDCSLENMDTNLDTFFNQAMHFRVINIQCGSTHALFLSSAGHVLACGANNSGQCGIAGSATSPQKYITYPQQIVFCHDQHCKIKRIAAGKMHSLFIDSKGRLLVCGYNYSGQLALKPPITPQWGLNDDDDDDMLLMPEDVAFGRPRAASSALASQTTYTFASTLLTADRDADDSELDGDDSDDCSGSSLCIYVPMVNAYFEKADVECSRISCGQYHSVVVTTDGECYTFGHNAFGNLGNDRVGELGEGEYEAFKLPIDSKVKECSSGYEHSMVLTEHNELMVFGDNSHQQCSRVCQQTVIKSPIKLSKCEEFGIDDKCYISNVCCSQNQSLIIYDPFERV